MKILWMSDSPTTPTGFGNVTRAICAGLADCGHQVSILGWQTREQVRWHRGSNSTLYPLPLRRQITANDVVEYLRRLQPDVFVILGKVMAFSRFNHPLIAKFVHTAGIARALYYPIDGDLGNGRLPPEWIDVLKTVDLPIAMSRYGSEITQANGVRPTYIPFGVDTKVFHPPESKEQAKRALGYDGQFVILTDACNQQRKQLPRALEIFRRFAEGKDDVLLHLQCDPEDPTARWQDEYCYDLR